MNSSQANYKVSTGKESNKTSTYKQRQNKEMRIMCATIFSMIYRHENSRNGDDTSLFIVRIFPNNIASQPRRPTCTSTMLSNL